MATFDVIDKAGNKVSTVELDDAVFAAPVRETLFYEVIKWQDAKRRQGTHLVRNRSLVKGGGKKPWKQKGTGRARQGSTRASQWVGGGRAMRPKPKSYAYALPKRVRKGALRSALSLRAKEGRLLILEDLDLPEIKTKAAREMLSDGLGVGRGLIVEQPDNRKLQLSVRNLEGVHVLPPEGLNLRDVLRHDSLILTKDMARKLEERLR